MAENEEVKVDAEVEDLGVEPEDLDTTDWKAEALKARGIAKRNATRLEKLQAKAKETKVETPPEQVEKKVEKNGFDYAEKAYLKASGIVADEFPLVEEIMKSTGKSIDEVLEAKYFQSELKERRDSKASQEAIPTGSKRSTASARDSVDYWIAKGTLPPMEQRELRTKVLNARIAAERSHSTFTDNPIA